ncbi:MAG TPA: hypothetical protein VGF84_12590, partial [Micromonosporaceae bacterium]
TISAPGPINSGQPSTSSTSDGGRGGGGGGSGSGGGVPSGGSSGSGGVPGAGGATDGGIGSQSPIVATPQAATRSVFDPLGGTSGRLLWFFPLIGLGLLGAGGRLGLPARLPGRR